MTLNKIFDQSVKHAVGQDLIGLKQVGPLILLVEIIFLLLVTIFDSYV